MNLPTLPADMARDEHPEFTDDELKQLARTASLESQSRRSKKLAPADTLELRRHQIRSKQPQ